MIIKVAKFGTLLTSRPSGQDAYFSAKAYLLPKKLKKIEFDFDGVKVLTPSWIDEFIILLKKDYKNTKIVFRKSNNPSVVYSLEMLEPL